MMQYNIGGIGTYNIASYNNFGSYKFTFFVVECQTVNFIGVA